MEKKRPIEIKFRVLNNMKDADAPESEYPSGQVYFTPAIYLYWGSNICFSLAWMHLEIQLWAGRGLTDMLASDNIFF